MPKRIPISRAEDFGKLCDLKQVIIFGWDGSKTHVVTWGNNEVACAQAAEGANQIKKDWGWPDDTIVESTSVLALKARIAMLESVRDAKDRRIAELEDAVLASRKDEIKPTVHVIEGTEYERGWGQRPDGIIAFPSKAQAEAYIVDYNKKNNTAKTAPDEYTVYNYIGIKECSAEVYKAVLANGRHYTNSARDLMS